MKNTELKSLFVQAVKLWHVALTFQEKEKEYSSSLNTSDGFIPLDKSNVIALNKTKFAIKLFSDQKKKAIAEALKLSSEYAYKRYGVKIGKKYRFEIPGWDSMDLTVDILKPAGSTSNPMIVCMGYLDSGVRKSVILTDKAIITPMKTQVINIEYLLRLRAGKVPIVNSAKK